jgi:ribosomal protein L3 glutamine methyltransferase
MLQGTTELQTLRDWLEFAEKLYVQEQVALGQVAATAHDEALYLLLRTLELPLDSKPQVLSRVLGPAQGAEVAGVLARRVFERIPAAYITREAFLGGHRFYVDERVIIPRSYFVEIIPQELPHWLPHGLAGVKRAADVCTGSGCLALLLAHHCPDAKVDAVELSRNALEVAEINVTAHHEGKRVKLFHSDCFKNVPHEHYDVIISNPPYEPSAVVKKLPPEFKKEPRLALDGGTDGMKIVRRIIRQAAERLSPHGVLLLEIGALHAAIDEEYGHLEPVWLPTEDGSNSICLFQAGRLKKTAKRARKKSAR